MDITVTVTLKEEGNDKGAKFWTMLKELGFDEMVTDTGGHRWLQLQGKVTSDDLIAIAGRISNSSTTLGGQGVQSGVQ